MDVPFDGPYFDVSRWDGKHTDGPDSDFYREPEELRRKDGAGPVSRSSDDIIHFGKHKGKRWSEIPTGYLVWMVDNFSGKGSRKIIEKARIEIAIRRS